jgi:cytochrome P450
MPRRYPPGPINFNFWCGFTWRHAYHQSATPLEFVTDLAQRYGDIVFYRLFIYPTYQVNHPDLIREVLVTKASSFLKQARSRELIRRVAGAGLLTTDGPEWLRKRRMMMPAFQSQVGQRMAEVAVEEVRRTTDPWGDGREVQLYRSMTELMIRTVSRSFFGMETAAETERVAGALQTLAEHLVDLDYFMARPPGWLPWLKQRRRREAEGVLTDYFDQAIASRRQRPVDQRDLLGLLLNAADHEGDRQRMTEREVRAEAQTMFYAGHHTAAACLTWTLYLLAQHPQVRQTVLGEIDEVLSGRPPAAADIPRLSYTTQVIQESMRLYPPAWTLFAREATQEVEIGGYSIPRGSWVFIYPWVVHHDARFFLDPQTFKPERFSPENFERIPVGAYIPFGLGAHNCIGGRIAMMAIQLALPAILQRFVLDLAAEQGPPELYAAISLRPKRDIHMLANPRPVARS